MTDSEPATSPYTVHRPSSPSISMHVVLWNAMLWILTSRSSEKRITKVNGSTLAVQNKRRVRISTIMGMAYILHRYWINRSYEYGTFCNTMSGKLYRIWNRVQNLESKLSSSQHESLRTMRGLNIKWHGYWKALISRTATIRMSLQKHQLSLSQYQLRLSSNHRNVINEDIQSVLSYWFAASPNQSTKFLWMNSNQSQLAKLDFEIYTRFGTLLKQLYSNSSGQMALQWCNYSWEGGIAAIVVLDQFSRHILRHANQQVNSNSYHSQSEYDRVALLTSQSFHTHYHATHVITCRIPQSLYLFTLLPNRHANNLTDVQTVMQRISKTMEVNLDEEQALIKRFRSATTRRLNVLQDSARRAGVTDTSDDAHLDGKGFSAEDILEMHPFTPTSSPENHVVTSTITQWITKQINSNTEKKSDAITTATKDISIIISLSGGVDSMVILASLHHILKTAATRAQQPTANNKKGKQNGTQNKQILLNGKNTISITCLHINYNNRPESIAEADYLRWYCNHLTSDNDIQVQYHVRSINECHRGTSPSATNTTSRDDYERQSRSIRYTFYQEHTSPNTSLGVLLGHHRGDIIENVLSNCLKGCTPLDISGMTSQSIIEGVAIHRPLLSLTKDAILEYAHVYGVPYFKDTTPSWSTRGKLRNLLLPLVTDMYGEGSLNHLANLATESDDVKQLFQELILKGVMEGVTRYDIGLRIDLGRYLDSGDQDEHQQQYTLFFWKFVLREILHSAGRGMFSDKSVKTFLERMDKLPQPPLSTSTKAALSSTVHSSPSLSSTDRSNYHAARNTIDAFARNKSMVSTSAATEATQQSMEGSWLQCRKDYAVFAHHATRNVYVLHPESFPWNKRDYYNPNTNDPNKSVALHGLTNDIRIGPWVVQTDIVPLDYDDADFEAAALLTEPVFPKCMETFMKGEYVYHLCCPKPNETLSPKEPKTEETELLEILWNVGFNKANRPQCFRSIDAKIEQTLPWIGLSKHGLDKMDSCSNNASGNGWNTKQKNSRKQTNHKHGNHFNGNVHCLVKVCMTLQLDASKNTADTTNNNKTAGTIDVLPNNISLNETNEGRSTTTADKQRMDTDDGATNKRQKTASHDEMDNLWTSMFGLNIPLNGEKK